VIVRQSPARLHDIKAPRQQAHAALAAAAIAATVSVNPKAALLSDFKQIAARSGGDKLISAAGFKTYCRVHATPRGRIEKRNL
jgi:hypothetical protein